MRIVIIAGMLFTFFGGAVAHSSLASNDDVPYGVATLSKDGTITIRVNQVSPIDGSVVVITTPYLPSYPMYASVRAYVGKITVDEVKPVLPPPDYIGTASMDSNRTITVNIRDPKEGLFSAGTKFYKISDPKYQELKTFLGDIEPGEVWPVRQGWDISK